MLYPDLVGMPQHYKELINNNITIEESLKGDKLPFFGPDTGSPGVNGYGLESNIMNDTDSINIKEGKGFSRICFTKIKK